jgi:TRAP transporter TAXI family solute receptor
VLGGAAALAAVGALGKIDPALAAKIYQWGSSSLGSTGYVIVSVLAATVTKFTKLRNSSLSTSGASENMLLLGEGVIDLGQTTSADWKPATEGLDSFAGKPVKLHQMFAYTAWQLSPMVKADSKIEKIEDLAGKRVMPVVGGGTTHLLWRELFTAAGMSEKDLRWSFGSWTESYGAMKANATDCVPILLTNGRPSPTVTELEANMQMRVLDIPQAVFDKAQKRNPGILSTVVEPGPKTSKYVTKPTRMVTLSGILGSNVQLPPDDAYTMVKAIMENLEFVHSKGTELRDIGPEFSAGNLMPLYPVNAGAARYFKERGVWKDGLVIAS